MANKESVAYLSDLDDKLNGLAKVARTGSYNDLKDQPAPLSPGQQAALDSGITPEKVRKLDDLPDRAELGTELGKKRDLTNLSVDQNKWLLVKPDGTQVWLVDTSPGRWMGDGFVLTYGEDGGEFMWGLVGPSLVVDDTSQLPSDADRLEFLGSDGFSVYSLVRGSRLVLDTEIPPAQVNADWNATGGVAQILNKPEIPVVPTPIAPSTEVSAKGKPADAKDTGDALEGKRGLTDLAVYESAWVLSVPGGGTFELVKPFPSANQWQTGESVGDYAILHTPSRPDWSLFTVGQSGTPERISTVTVLDGDPDAAESLDFGQGYTARLQAVLAGDTLAKTSLVASKQDALSEQQLANIAAVPGKYEKPSGGIPATDLAQAVQTALDSIPDKANNDLVPEGTNSSTNMLVNQQGLNGAIQTYSAHYRGYFQTWYDVPDDPLMYRADSDGNHEPGPNDYIAVGNMSDYPYGDDSSDSSGSGGGGYSGAWRMTYSGTWSSNGKSGWEPAFQYNENPLSDEQQAALDSGITADLVDKLDGIESGAQVNVIDGIKVNGSAISPVSKVVDIPVPVIADNLSDANKAAEAKEVGDALAKKEDKSNKTQSISEQSTTDEYPSAAAVQARFSALAQVATSGSYNDLQNKPTIPTAQVNSDWNATGGVAKILNKPSIPSTTDDITYTPSGGDAETLTSALGDIDVAKADVEDLNYAILQLVPEQGQYFLSNRTVNVISASGEQTIELVFPHAEPGKSRDFYLAVTCGSTTPTLNTPSGVTLVNAKGEPPDLSLSADAATVLRFTEVKEADDEADPPEHAVFCVTGGANGGGGSIDPAVLEDLRSKLDLRVYDYEPWSVTLPDSSTVSLAWDNEAGMWTASDFSYWLDYSDGEWSLTHYESGEGVVVGTVVGDGSETQLTFDDEGYTYTCERESAILIPTGDSLATSSQVATKAESAALAPAWISGHAYFKGDHVSYEGLLYECLSTVAGSTNPSADTTHWKLTDLAAPDATLDILSDGRLRVVAADGDPLWTQGYALASESAVALSCEKINKYVFAATTATAFSDSSTYAVGDRVVYGGKVYKCSTAVETAGAWTGATNWDEDPDTQAFALPNAPSGIVGDFVLDVDNTANEVPVMVAISGTLGTTYDLIVEKGRSSVDVLTIEGGALAELYFTMTAFGTAAKPAWRVVRLNVERQEAGS